MWGWWSGYKRAGGKDLLCGSDCNLVRGQIESPTPIERVYLSNPHMNRCDNRSSVSHTEHPWPLSDWPKVGIDLGWVRNIITALREMEKRANQRRKIRAHMLQLEKPRESCSESKATISRLLTDPSPFLLLGYCEIHVKSTQCYIWRPKTAVFKFGEILIRMDPD
jgi:hypothetical protein